MPIKKQKKYRLVIEFETLSSMKMHMILTNGLFAGDINARKMDSLDFKRHYSNYDSYVVRKHSQIPEALRLFEDPV